MENTTPKSAFNSGTDYDCVGSLEAILDTLRIKEVQKQDFVSDSRSLQMRATADGIRLAVTAPDVTKELAQDSFTLSEFAHTQVAAKLNIPTKYYNRMAIEQPDLLTENVNTWLQANSKRRYFVRSYKTGEIRTILSDKYKVIDNLPVIDGISKAVKDNNIQVQVHKAHVNDDTMHIDLHHPEREAVIRTMQENKDTTERVMAGLMITNSEVGNGAFMVQPQVIRLMCVNGIITQNVYRQVHIGQTMGNIIYNKDIRQREQALVVDKLRETIPAVLMGGEFDKMVSGLEEAAGIEVEPIAEVKNLTKRYALTDGEHDSILATLGGYDPTRYGVGQSIAQVARDTERFNRKVELMEVAAEYSLLRLATAA